MRTLTRELRAIFLAALYLQGFSYPLTAAHTCSWLRLVYEACRSCNWRRPNLCRF